MGRIQSSIGLVTGTDIMGTVDQLMAINGRSRDRLVAQNETQSLERQSLAELTASVIGVQLSGDRLSSTALFRSKKAESSLPEALSVTTGSAASSGTHQVRTIQTAATHDVRSLQRFTSAETALGFVGKIEIRPGEKLLDESVALAKLNGGRGVEPGSVRITDRSGATAEIDLSKVQTMDDVLAAINDAGIAVRATTAGNRIELTDESGSTLSNLKVEQLGDAETAADLGLWGIDEAADTATGIELELPDGVHSLRGAALSELKGGNGLAALTRLEITLSDGSATSIDLSAATTTSEIIDAINGSGLKVTARLNDARNGFQIRDVSGGSGNFSISSLDDTASSLGIEASSTDDIVIGANLNRQTVTLDSKLSELNGGLGVGEGSFTITDSSGGVGAVNIKAEGIKTVGELVNAINDLGLGLTASLNENGDGIAIVDTAGGSESLTIKDTGSGQTAAKLGIAGVASDQDVGGAVVSALIGTQADVIQVNADDSLDSILQKLSSDPRYAKASIQTNEDGTVSLNVKSTQGGEAGKLAINTSGFNLDFRSETRGQDAVIAVTTDGGIERFLSAADGVFDLSQGAQSQSITSSTPLAELNQGRGISLGSIKITDSAEVASAINLQVEGITTVGGLVNAINALGIGVSAAINQDGTGIQVIDTAGGDKKLTIEDVGNGKSASDLGIAGEATQKTIDGTSVSALVGPGASSGETDSTGVVLTIKTMSDSPITVTVSDNPEAATKAVETFVSQYNKLMDKLDQLSFYDADEGELGLLFGSTEVSRIRNGYSHLLSGRITQAGDFKSLGQVGIRINTEGRLELDSEKMTKALADDPSSVESFFTTADTGLADRLSTLADRIAGPENSLLISRSNTLDTQINQTNQRVEQMNERLEKERERLLNQFYATEQALAKIQGNTSYIDQIQRISIPT